MILTCYIKIFKHIKKNPDIFSDSEAQHMFLTRMIAYPAIILIAFIPLNILRLIQSNDGLCGHFPLAIVAYACFGSYGFLNAIAYGYNDSINQYLRGLCKRGYKLTRPRGTDLFSTLSEGVIND